MRGELQNVKEENNRQQQLLAQNLQLPPEARIEASLQHEITRLTNENLVRCNVHQQTHTGWGRRVASNSVHLKLKIKDTTVRPHVQLHTQTHTEAQTQNPKHTHKKVEFTKLEIS